MKKLGISALCFFVITFASPDSFADNFDDLFGDVPPPTKESVPQGLLGSLLGNSSFKLTARTMGYYETPTPRQGLDDRSIQVEGKLDMDTNYKVGSDLFNLSGWLEYGTPEDYYQGITEPPRDRNRHRRFFELDEFSWTHGWSSADLTLGKKVFKQGIATIYSPSNRLNQVDANDPTNSKEIGNWLMGLDYFIEDSTLSLVVWPYFNPIKRAPDSSRWTGTGTSTTSYESLLGSTSSTSSTASYDYPGFELENISFLFRGKTTYEGWDLFLATFHGPNYYPVLKSDGTSSYKIQHVNVSNTSAGFSTTLKRWEFHGEALYQHAYSSKDDNYLNYVLGFNYGMDEWVKPIGLEKIDWTVEYTREELTEKQSHPDYTQSSKNSRVSRDNILTRAIMKASEKLRIGLGFNYDFDQHAHTESFGFEYKLDDGLIAKVHSEFYNGKSDTYYGQWKENDRLVTTLEYLF